MHDHRRSPARLLAPLMLGLVAVIVIAVIISSGSDEGGKGAKGNAKEAETRRTTTSERARTTTERRPAARTYTVKVNDTLGGIAEETGVSVEQLLELNPDLDPQALVSGQKIKLRE